MNEAVGTNQRGILYLALASAVTLSLLGFGLHDAWHSKTIAWPWLLASLAMVAIIGRSGGAAMPPLPGWMTSPWPWLGLALLIVGLTPILGFSDLGAKRWYGDEAFRVRASLWGMVALIGFLALYADQEKPRLIHHGLAIFGLAIFLLAISAQPDIFSMPLLATLGLFFGLKARHATRVGLTGMTLIGALLGGLVLWSSPYRWMRFKSYWTGTYSDPLGADYVPLQSQLAFEQAGWWGMGGDMFSSGMATMPSNQELYALPYLSLWQGNAAVLLAVAMLLVFAWAVFQLARAMPRGGQKNFVQAGLLVFALNHVIALGAPLRLLPYTGHFGIAFLGAGEMGLMALLLLWVSMLGQSRPHAISTVG